MSFIVSAIRLSLSSPYPVLECCTSLQQSLPYHPAQCLALLVPNLSISWATLSMVPHHQELSFTQDNSRVAIRRRNSSSRVLIFSSQRSLDNLQYIIRNGGEILRNKLPPPLPTVLFRISVLRHVQCVGSKCVGTVRFSFTRRRYFQVFA